jgi:hypothetical protein
VKYGDGPPLQNIVAFDISKWDQIFKDPTTTAAAVDRLVHHSVIIELNLESCSLETSRKPGKHATSVAPDAETPNKSEKHSNNHN